MFGFGTWKIALLASVTSLAVGFYAGQRWEKADRYKDMLAQMEALQIQSEANLVLLNDRWEAEVARVKIEVEEWNQQNSIDNSAIEELLNGQRVIKEKFDDLNTEINTTATGKCDLSDDAIRLLNHASDLANNSDPSTSTGDTGTGEN